MRLKSQHPIMDFARRLLRAAATLGAGTAGVVSLIRVFEGYDWQWSFCAIAGAACVWCFTHKELEG